MGTSAQAILISVASIAIAYLIGAIPFGLLVARWARGIDIRTVGSGNIGATNVGRVLGIKFFFLVFALDMLKGLLPTLGIPWLLTRAGLPAIGALPVLLALATILGHNFPVYLRFQGGKGVATSFGALIALDPVAMLSAGVSFVAFLLVTRYVSMSSILAGVVFAIVHFARTAEPWTGANLPMSLLTLALLALLVVRHRKNIGRLAAGTEPKVSLRKKKEPPAGRVAAVAVVALALAAAGGALAIRTTSRPALDCGNYRLTAGPRLHTGHQRAERLAFLDGGRLLAITCPRYDRIVLAEVRGDALRTAREIALEGRPVAIWSANDRLYVLERPIADARHMEAGWLEAFDLAGKPLGAKLRVGFDPDDLVLSADARLAFLLLSGHAEGETNRPDPELQVLDLSGGLAGAKVVGRVVFDQPGDDPERIALAADGASAAVSLWGTNCVAQIDLADPAHPSVVRRTPVGERPGPALFQRDGRLIVSCDTEPGLWRIPAADGTPDPGSASRMEARALPVSGPGADVVSLGASGEDVVCTLPQNSALEVIDTRSGQSRGRLPIRGRANLGTTRPLGMAYEASRGLLAVANRQGGSVHLVKVEPAPSAAQRAVVTLEADSSRK